MRPMERADACAAADAASAQPGRPQTNMTALRGSRWHSDGLYHAGQPLEERLY
jgi:hypothetical protein